MTAAATETRTVVVEREIAYPPEKIWRALTEPHLIEDWLMKNDFRAGRGPQVQSARRLGRRRLPGPQSRAAEDARLQLGGQWAREHGHLDAHPDERRHAPQDGAVRLPAGSGAVLSGRQDGLAKLLRQAGAGAGAGGVTNARRAASPSTASRAARARKTPTSQATRRLADAWAPFRDSSG